VQQSRDVSAIDNFSNYIGRSIVAEDVVTPRALARFQASLAHYLAPVGSGEAPLGFHWCLAPDATAVSGLGVDGNAAKGKFLPPVPLSRRMWAGGEIEILAPIRSGDRVERHSTIVDIKTKTGRSGTLCFVGVRHEIWTDRGISSRERQDIVYREPTGASAAPNSSEEAKASSSPAPDIVWRIDPDPVLLFRYSALTFNSHRIHYDYPYATHNEGYEGLVVHGPLQATLLLNAAAVLNNRVPRRFTYRGNRPLIAGVACEVCAVRIDTDSVNCWTRDASGRAEMTGAATW
jgi:3-methylfumaryl-CoA hydratase